MSEHRHSARQTLLLFAQPRQLVVFFLGVAQGAPNALISATLMFWLSEVGRSNSEVGLFGFAIAAYALKPLWAPFLDQFDVPLLGRKLGSRRAWLVVLQLLLIISISGLGLTDPENNLMATAILAATIGFLSASQDILTDAFRIEILSDDEQGAGAAMVQFGWRVGALLTGAGTLLMADQLGYAIAFTISGFFILPGLIAALWWGEPEHVETPEARCIREASEEFLASHGVMGRRQRIVAKLNTTVVSPFREFMSRPGWWLILLFIPLFKLGDAVGLNQFSPFLVDLGFTATESALANKTAGLPPLLIGVAVGGTIYYALGTFRALVVAGFMMMLTNLGFIWLAYAGHSIPALMITVGIENFASGVGGTAVVAYLSSLCNRSFTASQYALLAGFSLLPRGIFASFSGFLSEQVSWEVFWFYSTLLAIPGLLMLFAMRRIAFDAEGHPLRETMRETAAQESPAE